MVDVIQWVKENCKLPFTIVKRSEFNTILDRPKTKWKREDAKQRKSIFLKK